MNTAMILLCGDHSRTRQVLERALIRMGSHVTLPDGTLSPLVVTRQQPNLVFIDDLTICRQLRENRHALPIFFSSSHGGPQQVMQALDQGLMTPIVVSFAREEVAARIRARLRYPASLQTIKRRVIRRCNSGNASKRRRGHLPECSHRHMHVNHQDVCLTRPAFPLLQCFLLHAGKTLTYDFLRTTVWGPEYEGMDEYVRWLRQKREPDVTHPTSFQTQLNQGYVFSQPEANI